ncbi:MAG: hypothetical protein PVG56_08480 [Anaerolineae bacterium]
MVGKSRQSSRLIQGHQRRTASRAREANNTAPASAKANQYETSQQAAGITAMAMWTSFRDRLRR